MKELRVAVARPSGRSVVFIATWTSVVLYVWRGTHRLWCFALVARLLFGRTHALFTRSWSCGPLTVALTDLRGRLYQ